MGAAKHEAWAFAVTVVAIVAGLTIYNVIQHQDDTRVRVACVQSGGTLDANAAGPKCLR